jgi:hypothetical protein
MRESCSGGNGADHVDQAISSTDSATENGAAGHRAASDSRTWRILVLAHPLPRRARMSSTVAM